MPLFFPKRGIHLDLRIQTMPMGALRAQVRTMAEMNFNILLIEWEATFPFRTHPIISNQFAYTPAEIASFIGFCRDLGIEVIPLQQCFGHVEYILRHPRYAHLREDQADLCQICPSHPERALEIFRPIFDELAAAHPSSYIHIGGDETYLLGHCPTCRSAARKSGKSKLYVDYFRRMAELVVRRGKRPMIWADMLLKYPEAANEMPAECVFVDWNYGWPVNRFGDLSKIASRGFELWGAAALRSHPDNHSFTNWRKHFQNLCDYLPYARRFGFKGVILTSWSTSGVYDFQWERPGELLEMHPIRRVYPHVGFRILEAAFAAALDEKPFSPEAFVMRYARERFGLGPEGGRRLWSALVENSNVADDEVDLGVLLAESDRCKRCLHRLRPTKHRGEFEHLRLMADLRDHDLRFRLTERRTQSEDFAPREIPAALAQLRPLIREANVLDARCLKLWRGALHPGEIQADLEYRCTKLRQLHARLARTGRNGGSPAALAGTRFA